MALTAGSVTVNADGTHSGSGAALAMFEQAYADYEDSLDSPPTDPIQIAGVKRSLANLGKLFATYTTYLTTNGSAGGDPIV